MSRHIGRKHKDEEAVKQALELPKKERIKAFGCFRSEGIFKTNKREIVKKIPQYERSRKGKTDEDLVMCNGCKEFVLKSSLPKHRRTCNGNERSFAIDLPLLKKEIPHELSEAFKKHILASLRNDEVGLKCKDDHAVLLFGVRLYDKVKRCQNIIGARRDVRSKMRMLVHLYIHFMNQKPTKICFENAKDMFHSNNFESLKKAIKSYTSPDEEEIKAGLKNNLQFVLIKAAKIFKGQALTDSRKEEAMIFEDFLGVLELWKVNYICYKT